MKKIIKAWYFAPKDEVLRYGDGRTIKVGITHSVGGEIKTCVNGLHGSERLIDALRYAESSILYRVNLYGNMDIDIDKIAAGHRRYLQRFNIESILFEFSRNQALINIEKIKPYTSKKDYNLIVKWLNTGNIKIRSAAASAARSAAESAARSAAASAAWSAAWSAAASAAESAAASAAWSAAWSASEEKQEEILISRIEEKFGILI